jgi:hypothetical protein
MRSLRKVASRSAENVRALADGFRYASGLPAPANGQLTEREPPGRLETYFDEHTAGPGIWKWRHYFPVYERHFSKFVGREVHIAEVGIYSGGSLSMWLDFFGEGAHIYGIDIAEACRVYAGDRVDVFIGDQSDPAFWRRFLAEVPRIDILIDDGGHRADLQIATLKATLASISPGGVYACEDSHGASHAFHAFVDGLGRRLHEMGEEASILHQHVGSIHRYPSLTVIEKPLLPVAPFESARHGTEWHPFFEPADGATPAEVPLSAE